MTNYKCCTSRFMFLHVTDAHLPAFLIVSQISTPQVYKHHCPSSSAFQQSRLHNFRTNECLLMNVSFENSSFFICITKCCTHRSMFLHDTCYTLARSFHPFVSSTHVLKPTSLSNSAFHEGLLYIITAIKVTEC